MSLGNPTVEREEVTRRANRHAHDEPLLLNLTRASFLILVLFVLWGVVIVSRAHLTEQFLAVERQSDALIDPDEGEDALTPENIEAQILAFTLRLREEELLIPAGDDPRPRAFTINPGEPARYIAARLAAAGFINDADLFNLYLRVEKLDREIEAGNFMLADSMTIPEIARELQQARFEEVLVTIPEGFRAEEIAERLAQNFVIDSERFLTAVRQPQSLGLLDNYDFLNDLAPDDSLEGYLFPDTYRFPVNASGPEIVLTSMLDNFENRVGAAGLSGGSSGMSGHELITLASIVEREAVQDDERPLIASVYINRLNNECRDVGGTYLQADPTVQYAKGTTGNWWWKPQTIEEYAQVESLYNTYLHAGLPPGPIASPGLRAIEATSNPTQTSYCFFLATGDEGRHVFAQTLAEHNRNFANYGYQP
ncbi:MAG: endolytic transglycosylase MltG [Caldilineaceae bacterium SB0668_bin_21]|nr:endolytic transglycosylase MltG [Caldilineaceae bacterium SB0668_bin_21]MYC22595.1 endolytic transglycosylase MltG [Caldilineaceae bacterium SB0662_bin_25]